MVDLVDSNVESGKTKAAEPGGDPLSQHCCSSNAKTKHPEEASHSASIIASSRLSTYISVALAYACATYLLLKTRRLSPFSQMFYNSTP